MVPVVCRIRTCHTDGFLVISGQNDNLQKVPLPQGIVSDDQNRLLHVRILCQTIAADKQQVVLDGKQSYFPI